MLYTQTGALLLLIIMGFSAQNVIAESNVTAPDIRPVYAPTTINPTASPTDITGILAIGGCGTYVPHIKDE